MSDSTMKLPSFDGTVSDQIVSTRLSLTLTFEDGVLLPSRGVSLRPQCWYKP